MYQVRFETFLQNYQETQYWEDKNYEEKTRGPSYKSIQHTNNLQGYSNDDTIKPMGINNLNDLKWWRIKSIDVSIKLLQHELKGNCLEIGAGGGLGSAYLSSFELVDRVDCLDYSLIAVEKLMPEVHSSIDIANPKKIRRVYGSYDNIKEKNYNFIYGSGALHNSKDLDKTFHSLYDALDPEGVFVSSDFALPFETTKIEEEHQTTSVIKKSLERFNKDVTYYDTSDYFRSIYDYLYFAKSAGFKVYPIIFSENRRNKKIKNLDDIFKNGALNSFYPHYKKQRFDNLLLICKKNSRVE